MSPQTLSKSWNNETKRAVAGLRTLSGTALLPAMKQAGERLARHPNVTRRILLALTDGQDSYAAEANCALCKWLRQRGVEVVGIALMTGGMAQTFNGAVVNVYDVAQLSTQGLSALVKALDAGAPRVG